MDGGLEPHLPHVYRLALRLTRNVNCAEDLTQETFLRACQRIDQVKHPAAIRTWLFRIAFNLMNDQFRTMAPANESNHAATDALSCHRPTPDKVAETNDDLAQALQRLDALPTQQRLVLFLVTVEQLSLAEVCEVLGITMTNAKAQLSLARKRMRDELQRQTVSQSNSISISVKSDRP